ncbi:MAG: efflux RND transporter periplasmic adaptor subunit [Acidobacteriaceae bacterium]|nr:efflux RND transporter periplasmic adaptor subunit [Acidobacteriaceae bacterium]MBV9779357.1 efflux RND transporter periplasmic adaptor subunit [Acidobacteriaceae bacterium]
MKRKIFIFAAFSIALGELITGCRSSGKVDESVAAPPPARVEEEPDVNLIQVDQPERFTFVKAGRREELPELHATGVVSPDVEKSIPVISLASGRVVGIYAKLGDDVKKGQLLLKVLSNDIAAGFQNYNQAKADEVLAQKQLERAKLLYEHGAISLNDFQVAEDTEEKAKVSLETAAQQLRTMGADPKHNDPVVNIYAPSDGTIIEQNVVLSASVHTPDNQPNLFTIANLARVWILADVYENDIPMVKLGDVADVVLNAYPDRKFQGRVTNIGRVLDPNLRTAKVRIELANPGIMRAGMFVTATFYGQHGRIYSTVPASAVLHLHDRDWVFIPAGGGKFRRIEISGGKITNGTQDVMSGLLPGQEVVNDALALNAEHEK